MRTPVFSLRTGEAHQQDGCAREAIQRARCTGSIGFQRHATL